MLEEQALLARIIDAFEEGVGELADDDDDDDDNSDNSDN
jgi:hypothetical protein